MRKVILFVAVFIFGLGVGMIFQRYGNLPHPVSTIAVRILDKIFKKNQPEDKYVNEFTELEKYYFVSPIHESGYLLNKKVESIDDLKQQIDKMKIPLDNFQDAFNTIEISGSTLIADSLMEIDFNYQGKSYSAFAYYKPTASENSGNTFLIIPGSRENQSSSIFNKDPENYQSNIMDLVLPFGDAYVYIKPNEDVLAIHNGEKKINYTGYVNYLLNSGSSYSANYIISAIAVSKYLKENYDNFCIAGLSQGGFACLLISLQTSPDISLVASGFSGSYGEKSNADHSQILIPNLYNIYSFNTIKSIIMQQDTRYLFMWGKLEKGTYRIEVAEQPVMKQFSGISNVECVFHKFGHAYPHDEITSFLKENLN